MLHGMLGIAHLILNTTIFKRLTRRGIQHSEVSKHRPEAFGDESYSGGDTKSSKGIKTLQIRL